MNIVVLCGGLSNEREVSIASGTGVMNALRRRGHKAILVDLFLGVTEEFDDPKELFDRPWREASYQVTELAPDLEQVRASRKLDIGSLVGAHVLEVCRAADFTFLALHGEEGENGKLQAMLDIEGIRYTGCGYLGSAIAMNKYLTKQLLLAAGVGTAEGVILRRRDGALRSIGFPCVVKPCSGGSSVGTFIVRDEAAYAPAVRDAFRFEDQVLVERFVKGRELTVAVMGGKAMPAVEIIPKDGFYDYRNKYQSGKTEELCPAPLTPEETERLARAAELVARTLLIDVYCRVDFIMDETGKLFCLEANTLPGMTATSLIPQMAAAQGMDYDDLCERILEESQKKYDTDENG